MVAFVGFVGGWTRRSSGRKAPRLAGIVGATRGDDLSSCRRSCSFLVGGPAVEATRHDLKFTAPLTGITAAVVGVIINLAVFFAWACCGLRGGRIRYGPLSVVPLLITIGAVALWRFHPSR